MNDDPGKPSPDEVPAERFMAQPPAEPTASPDAELIPLSTERTEEIVRGHGGSATEHERLTGPKLRLEEKHPLAVRWMHWINFPVLAVMIWSGLLIYWADSYGDGSHPHRVYRIGVGHWTLFRFFPDWFYQNFHLTFGLAKGLGYHWTFMWLFAINGILYVLYSAISGEWRDLVPNRKSFKEAIQVTLYDLHLSKVHPLVRKYNGAQRIAYTAIILMGFGSLVTGMAIYKPTQLHVLTTLLGGYEAARWMHFWLTILFVAFFFVHVAQVIRAGWSNFRSMIAGFELVRTEKEVNADEQTEAA